MAWERLSVRRGRASAEALVEGIPDYLAYPLTEWLRTEFGWHRPSSQGGVDQEFLRRLATNTRIPVAATSAIGGISTQITDAIQRNSDLFLDVLDATLYLRGRRANAQDLRQLLEMGASAWTVSADGTALQRRVNDAAAGAYESAITSEDVVSGELADAWSAAFGRHPDPSDAWDHAIKAVEELLIPMVLPNKPKANLGGVAGELGGPASHKWKLTPSTSSEKVDDGKTLEAMLRLIWPNPDRHGGGVDRRAPTQPEAERVVHLSVAIIELCRAGGLSKLT
ncbi:hypothetical protein [Microbacterium sp. B19]|uniref:hypothetical protein n=1 Tax=Microbacterium sp. B19 TaxID=96765 RepID=UPI0011D27A75|nr:hypothetical protein [Microbacterium sp. B19]